MLTTQVRVGSEFRSPEPHNPYALVCLSDPREATGTRAMDTEVPEAFGQLV